MNTGNAHFIWFEKVRNILNECGMSNIWDTQTFINSNWLCSSVKLKLKDQFVQTWHSLIENSSKAINDRIFKETFEFEKYFQILDFKKATGFCRFRTTNHKLPIEQGRWNNIERNHRICTLCDKNDIGDEFHYILQCKYFERDRKTHVPSYYVRNANILKFKQLMSSKNRSELIKLCKFAQLINKGVCAPG